MRIPVLITLMLALVSDLFAAEPMDVPTVVVVIGASGGDEFEAGFIQQASLWKETAVRAGSNHIEIGREGEPGERADLDRLLQVLSAEPKDGAGEFWLVLIGHGTFDGREAKFNLRGLDLGATDLAVELQAFQRPVAVINTTSASAPFINALSAPGRVIVTATRSGNEINFTRFGQHMAEVIGDPAADLDKDGQVSLLEAFLVASHRVGEFYESEGRLATEHALIEDNSDGLGTPAEWFRGVRAVRRAQSGAAPDGVRAHQFHLIRSEAEQRLSPEIRARRDRIELEIARLRDVKTERYIDDYYRELEALLLELAKLYDQATADET